jgi:hypothetical protein
MVLKSAVIAALCVVATHGFNTNDQVNPDIPFGTFENPSAHVRPRFRSVAGKSTLSCLRSILTYHSQILGPRCFGRSRWYRQ